MDRHEEWINSQHTAQNERGAPSRAEVEARKRAMRTERAMIVDRATVESGK